MELHLTTETEAKLSQIAQRTQRSTQEVLEEAVNNLIAYNEWLEHKVRRSLAEAEQGHVVCDDEVLAWIEQQERS